ncbi:histone-lysine N-methyltransferase SETMAR-like [Aphis craccivora]|uniref:Histone-lysine N-methyltransferase SETMAR-like n=1 Tax=Aphis craccivora TaxID=307492 RepID=A0A6G0Y1U2_APHCR|nr:histone-lysine N-methyltransferase SETMAR-like [Aphis craccivora]
MPQPPYSPDMCDFFLFPKIKRTFKGHHFTVINIKSALLKVLKAILKIEFEKC